MFINLPFSLKDTKELIYKTEMFVTDTGNRFMVTEGEGGELGVWD